jgi:hypothetical protein
VLRDSGTNPQHIADINPFGGMLANETDSGGDMAVLDGEDFRGTPRDDPRRFNKDRLPRGFRPRHHAFEARADVAETAFLEKDGPPSMFPDEFGNAEQQATPVRARGFNQQGHARTSGISRGFFHRAMPFTCRLTSILAAERFNCGSRLLHEDPPSGGFRITLATMDFMTKKFNPFPQSLNDARPFPC